MMPVCWAQYEENSRMMQQYELALAMTCRIRRKTNKQQVAKHRREGKVVQTREEGERSGMAEQQSSVSTKDHMNARCMKRRRKEERME